MFTAISWHILFWSKTTPPREARNKKQHQRKRHKIMTCLYHCLPQKCFEAVNAGQKTKSFQNKLKANSCSQRFLDTSCFDQKQRPRGRPETKNNTRENATKSWRVYITVFHKSVLKPSMQARKQTETKTHHSQKGISGWKTLWGGQGHIKWEKHLVRSGKKLSQWLRTDFTSFPLMARWRLWSRWPPVGKEIK